MNHMFCLKKLIKFRNLSIQNYLLCFSSEDFFPNKLTFGKKNPMENLKCAHRLVYRLPL